MDAFIYIANFLYLAAYFTRDMFHLRALSLLAAACLVIYFASRQEVLLPVLGWNLVFVTLNGFQLIRLSLERMRDRGARNEAHALRKHLGNIFGVTDIV